MSDQNFKIIIPDGLEPKVKVVMLKGDTGEQGVKGKTGQSFRQYNGTIVADAPEGTEATIDMFKLSSFANAQDIVFDYSQNAQGNVEVRPWMVNSVNTVRDTADVQRWGSVITVPRGARGEVGPQGERGPQGLPGSISNTMISPSMLTADLQLSTYPAVDLVDNLTWHKNTFIDKNANIYNLIGDQGAKDEKEYTFQKPTSGSAEDNDNWFVSIANITKQTYTLSFEAKSTVNGDHITTLMKFTGDTADDWTCVTAVNGVQVTPPSWGNCPFQISDSYQRYSVTYTTKPENRKFQIGFRFFDSTGIVNIKNIRLTAGTDNSFGSIGNALAYLDVYQGETYYVKRLDGSSWLNAPMVVTDDNLNFVSSAPADSDPDHSYKIEIPAGGTKLFLNTGLDYHPMLFRQTAFNASFSALAAIDTLWEVVKASRTPRDMVKVSLTHVDKSQYSSNTAFWDYQRGILVESNQTGAYESVYACKPIKVSPYYSYTVTGYNVNNSNLVTILDAKGNAILSIPGKKSLEQVENYVFTIPSNGAYMMVNDNKYAGSTTELWRIISWN